MHLSKQISSSNCEDYIATNPRDFANLERYQNRQPAIYNQFFGINLLEAVDRLPPLSKHNAEVS